MEVKKTEASSSQLTTTINLFDEIGQDLPRDVKQQAAESIGEYLVEQIILSVAGGKSPIAGEGTFKKLSQNYKKKKVALTGEDKPNLSFTGEMLESLDYKVLPDGSVEVGIYGDDAGKADGHNNFSGESRLPQRRFLPAEGQEFKRDILKEAEKIINDVIAENTEITDDDLDGITTTSGLYDMLREKFTGMNRAEIKLSVLRNPGLVDLFSEADVLDLL